MFLTRRRPPPSSNLVRAGRRRQVRRKPVAGATVTLAGLPGAVTTDADGAFTWHAPPPPPFQVIVVLPGGQVAKPVDVEEHRRRPVCRSQVDALADESVTVIGAAPSIDAPPAAGDDAAVATRRSRDATRKT